MVRSPNRPFGGLAVIAILAGFENLSASLVAQRGSKPVAGNARRPEAKTFIPHACARIGSADPESLQAIQKWRLEPFRSIKDAAGPNALGGSSPSRTPLPGQPGRRPFPRMVGSRPEVPRKGWPGV
jgi:hypothetical protein